MVAQLRAKLTAPLLCFLLLATLAGCSLIPTNGLSPTSNLALPAPMMLSQVGSRPVIVPTAANKPALHLMGATVWGLPADIDQQHEGFGEAQYAQRTTVLQTLKNWGANAIRLRLDVSAMQGGAGLTQAQYIQHVVDWVREATAQNLYVNICFWDSLYNANNKWFGGYKQDFNFMRTVYAALGNNPRVVYEPWNEPNGLSASDWLTAMQDTVGFYRSFGYHGVLIIDLPNWAHDYDPQGMSALVHYDSRQPGMNGGAQIAFAHHDYANNRAWSGNWTGDQHWVELLGGANNPFPIVETEVGNYTTGNADLPLESPGWSKKAATFFGGPALRLSFYGGAFAFVFGAWGDNNAITGADNQTLTAWGQDVKQFLLAPSKAA